MAKTLMDQYAIEEEIKAGEKTSSEEYEDSIRTTSKKSLEPQENNLKPHVTSSDQIQIQNPLVPANSYSTIQLSSNQSLVGKQGASRKSTANNSRLKSNDSENSCKCEIV